MKKIIITSLAVIGLAIVTFAWPYPTETVPQTQTILNSYFQNGAYPNQTNYAEFVDTMFWLANQEYTNAQFAISLAEQATENNPLNNHVVAFMDANWEVPGTHAVTFNVSSNINLTLTGDTNDALYFYFSTPLADTNYIIFWGPITTNTAYSTADINVIDAAFFNYSSVSNLVFSINTIQQQNVLLNSGLIYAPGTFISRAAGSGQCNFATTNFFRLNGAAGNHNARFWLEVIR